MDTNEPSGPTPPISEMPQLKTPRTTPVARTTSSFICEQAGGLACMLISEDKDDGHLKHEIQEVGLGNV